MEATFAGPKISGVAFLFALPAPLYVEAKPCFPVDPDRHKSVSNCGMPYCSLLACISPASVARMSSKACSAQMFGVSCRECGLATSSQLVAFAP
jgi:hypothetical protein